MSNKKDHWSGLASHAEKISDVTINNLFAADPGRFPRYTVEAAGLFLDYSKNRANDETLHLLNVLARATDLENWRDKMFSGAAINMTERRAVLHTALRRPITDKVMVEGEDIMPDIHRTLERIKTFTNVVRTGQWKGHTGKPLTAAVSIGIGGSDLGPRMVVESLKFRDNLFPVRFVSNVDGADIGLTLRDLDPETTLVIVASKTFTTQETMANAAAAKSWFLDKLKDEKAVGRHFIALSTNIEAVAAFGIAPDNMFPFRDWVGGRYSLWSSIGLPIALAFGFDVFKELLAGARDMDRHFHETPLEKNMPVILALLGLWYRNFHGAGSYAVLPYACDLRLFPMWLQQLDMESNGKSTGRDDHPITHATGPVVFGVPGTDCQHSFFQLIHQGTDLIPCDFIGIINPPVTVGDQHRLLLANMLAQAQALMQGRGLTESGSNPHRAFGGNRPSNTLLLDRLDARRLGALLALYEHKIFVQGILWNINSFDQWGVELGKTLAAALLGGSANPDPSTAGLQDLIRRRTVS